jgi:hypothetical protein
MNRGTCFAVIFGLGSILSLPAGLTSVPAAAAPASETMTDRCSAEVAFVPAYDAHPNAHGTIILKRDKEGHTAWSRPFTVKTGDDGHIRWWCHSTIGNEFDPGTWRINVNEKEITACLEEVFTDKPPQGNPDCKKAIKLSSSAFAGWTPERSRCGNHSTRIRARLGPDRLLQTECLGGD